VIDEAHQFYFAEMVQKIISTCNPRHVLLMTGTPSPMILRKMPVYIISMGDLDKKGMMADLRIANVAAPYNINQSDYTQVNELRGDFELKLKPTISALKKVLKVIGDYYEVTTWKQLSDLTKKGLIACRNQSQALFVAKYLRKEGLGVALSTSDYDVDSTEIQRFLKKEDCHVLVVVARGVLGFNFPDLSYAIDMTTSQNLDRIYQLMSRVVRKSIKGKDKIFIKVAPENLIEYFGYVMTATLCLTQKEWLEKYNGKNFLEMEIPETEASDERESSGIRGDGLSPRISIDKLGVPIINIFNNVFENKGQVSFTNLQKVRNRLTDKKRTVFWTLEACKQDAKKYKTRSEWMKNSSGYHVARKNKWLKECCAHMEVLKGKWTFKACFNDAQKYNTLAEWSKNSTGYSTASYRGWVPECTKHMDKSRSHTFESCLRSALKCKTKKEWGEMDASAKATAMAKGWYKECTKHMVQLRSEKKTWTKDECLMQAKKFTTKKDWKSKSSSSYQAAIKNNWLKECSAHMEVLKGKWTFKACVEDAKKHKTRKEWAKSSGSAYSVAVQKGWLKKCCKHMEPTYFVWTLGLCRTEAQKFSSRSQWQSQSRPSYNAAAKNGWVDKCASHMEILQGKWTFKACVEDAKKHKTRKEWAKGSSGAYSAAGKNGWLEACCKHMKVINRTHTLESCQKIAKKYKTKVEWSRSDGGSYGSAIKHGWLEQCCGHMVKIIGKWTLNTCKEDAKKYSKRSHWKRSSASAYSAASKNEWVEECCAHMTVPV